MAKTDIAEVKNTAIANVTDMEAFAGFEGAGAEEVTARDRRIPRIAILEPLSPQLKKNHEKAITGARAGDIVDTGVGEVIGGEENPILFLPVKFVKEYLEWAPRDGGKGLQGRHKDASILQQCEQNDKGAYFLPNGNEVIETAQFFGLNLADLNSPVWSFVPMSKGRYSAAKDFVERLARIKLPNGKPAPYFFQSWNLASLHTTKNNNDYYTWSIKPGPKVMELGDNWQLIVEEAKAMLAGLSEGTVSAVHDEEPGQASEDNVAF